MTIKHVVFEVYGNPHGSWTDTEVLQKLSVGKILNMQGKKECGEPRPEYKFRIISIHELAIEDEPITIVMGEVV